MHADTSGNALIGVILEERYRIDSFLARGGMSTVFEGVDLRLDRAVAIKVMTPQYAADPTFLMRFEREARAAAKLDNPHVVGVYDQGRDGDHVFLIMELVDGGTLRDLLHEQKQLSLKVALSVLEPVLDALAAAHRAGLVHRDVKPENVLISNRGEVKVADFGLVRAVTSTTVATGDVILGTVAYLSPEQVETGASDERSDVYSAGVVGYEMLTGTAPFTGDNALSVAYQHVHSEVPSVTGLAPGVPAAVAAVIDAATSRDALRRPAHAGEFLRQLRGARLQLGLTLGSVPIPQAARQRRPPRPAVAGTAVQPAPDRPDRRQPPPRAKSTVDLVRRRRRRIRLIGLSVVLVLAAVGTGGGIWLANQWTSAPVTVDRPVTDAVESLESAGLTPVLTTRYDDVTPSGQVVEMSPPADSRQRRGDPVTLVVSAGRPTVPEIAPGTDLEVAKQSIHAAELQPVTDPDSDVYDDALPVGAVVTTLPEAGVSLRIGSEVVLVRSKGPQPETIPDVAGKLTEDAQNKLLVDGFTLGPARTAFDASVAANTVIGTDPPVGTQRPRGTAVSLILAISKTVPEPSPGPIEDAAQELTAQGFTVNVGEPVFDGSIPGGDVVRVEPSPGTRIDPADPAVTLIASNAVTCPPLVGMTVGQARETLDGLSLDIRVRALFGSSGSAVTGQEPKAGTLLAPGSTVRVDAWP